MLCICQTFLGGDLNMFGRFLEILRHSIANEILQPGSHELFTRGILKIFIHYRRCFGTSSANAFCHLFKPGLRVLIAILQGQAIPLPCFFEILWNINASAQ